MRKIRNVIGLFLLLFLLCACSLFLNYEDTNGDDNYDLETITDEMIIEGSRSISIGSIESKVNNKGKLSINKFNGVKTIKTFNNGSYTITVDFKVTKGNVKLVLCDDEKIIHEFSINSENQTFTIADESKVYFKIAGESSGFELNYTYND
ncbi:MAG TPA: hypothetical protein GX692_03765 [Acholeplasmataceae bacterium]|nr:hypothetical protein [Acholeplasmataceae bacterium]